MRDISTIILWFSSLFPDLKSSIIASAHFQRNTMIGYNLLISLLGLSTVLGASYSPTLNLNNPQELTNAATQALKNLLTYHTPSSVSLFLLLFSAREVWIFLPRTWPQDGAFSQIETPWHESGMIWGMFMDYAQYTGDMQFSDFVTSALVDSSFKTAQ